VGNNPSGNNAIGFGALPAAPYYGFYSSFGSYAYFWSATEHDSYFAWSRSLAYNFDVVIRYVDQKDCGFSVRCVRD